MQHPVPGWAERTCEVCPGQVLGPGEFDVRDRPGRDCAWNARLGWRATPDGVPVCVHPYRVGLPAGAYKSAGMPVPPVDLGHPPAPTDTALDIPDEDRPDDLEGWFVAVLRVAPPEATAAALERVEAMARYRFAERVVIPALRRAWRQAALTE